MSFFVIVELEKPTASLFFLPYPVSTKLSSFLFVEDKTTSSNICASVFNRTYKSSKSSTRVCFSVIPK